ncbi:hypothetical protein C2W62_29780 [Candidatus Entotheonella serta]|nr:hypothetical protein C2W62_29780 [Candidatus Entotheonella serta]
MTETTSSVSLSNPARNGQEASGRYRPATDDDPKRKSVTVLSYALGRSHPLAERISPEAFRSHLERFFDLAVRHLQGSEDIIVHYMDDGVLALFGANRPCEDHAFRALQVALALQDYLHEAQLEGDLPPEELTLRMGLHTGHVIGKRFGNDPRVIYMAVGDTMQVAADLQTCADPGNILMSEVTYHLVEEMVHGVEEMVHGEVVGLVPVGANLLPVTAYKIYRLLSPQPSAVVPSVPDRPAWRSTDNRYSAKSGPHGSTRSGRDQYQCHRIH